MGPIASVVPDDDATDMVHVDPTHKYAITRRFIKSLSNELERKTRFEVEVVKLGDVVVNDWSFLVVCIKK